MLPSPDTKYK
jgi:hypothetical protein